MKEKLFHYNARIISIYDGDTCRADIDAGLGIWLRNEPLRLHRINAPEVRGTEREDGLKSRDFLRALLDGKDVVIETVKDKKGKYGRYLAEIWFLEGDEWQNVNDVIVANGHAEYKDY